MGTAPRSAPTGFVVTIASKIISKKASLCAYILVIRS